MELIRQLMWLFVLALANCYFAESAVNCENNMHTHVHNLNARLANIEDALGAVLKKNSELEHRIETLEDENRHLKAEVKVLGQERGHGQEEWAGDAEQEETGRQLAAGSRIKVRLGRRGVKVPRIVMSGDATVAFTATLKTTRTGLSKGQTIVYDHVVTNVGGAYYSTSGVFTAPLSGVYVFNCVTMLEPGDTQRLVLVKNGVPAMNIYIHGAGELRYLSSTALVTLQMSQDDKTWVQTIAQDWHGSGNVHGNDLSSFSGWLLAPSD